jgi:SAM-dependent methyltransferase
MALDDPQSNITAFWSATAANYDAHEGNVPARGSAEFEAWGDAIQRLLPAAPADVLDIACGTGFVSLIAAGLGHRVTGIDLSGPMLVEARRAASEQGQDIRFQFDDAVAPSFPPSSFDVITNRHFLWTLREPENAFRNWFQLLRPGGRVVSIDSFWFNRQQDDDTPAAPDDIFGRHYTKQTRDALPLMSMSTVDLMVEMFRRAGFGDVDVSELAEVHALAEHPPSDEPWHVIVATRS